MERLGYNELAKVISIGNITKTGNRKLKTENRKSKTSLDQLLVARGLAKSRAQAQALILAGRVMVEGVALPKAGVLVPTVDIMDGRSHLPLVLLLLLRSWFLSGVCPREGRISQPQQGDIAFEIVATGSY